MVAVEIAAVPVVEPEALTGAGGDLPVGFRQEEDVAVLEDDGLGDAARDRGRGMGEHAALAVTLGRRGRPVAGVVGRAGLRGGGHCNGPTEARDDLWTTILLHMGRRPCRPM